MGKLEGEHAASFFAVLQERWKSWRKKQNFGQWACVWCVSIEGVISIEGIKPQRESVGAHTFSIFELYLVPGIYYYSSYRSDHSPS